MFRFTIRDVLGAGLGDRMNGMARAATLAMRMILGAVVAYIAAPFSVMALFGYDHGGETEEFAVWTIPGGALLGLALHVYVGLTQRVKPPA